MLINYKTTVHVSVYIISTQIHNSLGITVIYVANTKSKVLRLYLRVKTKQQQKTEVQ